MTFCLSPPQKSREFFFKKVKQRQQGTGATANRDHISGGKF